MQEKSTLGLGIRSSRRRVFFMQRIQNCKGFSALKGVTNSELKLGGGNSRDWVYAGFKRA